MYSLFQEMKDSFKWRWKIPFPFPKGDLQTQKKDRAQHGFGIENVREAVEKNGGELEVEIREKSFYAGVILPLMAIRPD